MIKKLNKNFAIIFLTIIVVLASVYLFSNDAKKVEASGPDWFDPRWEYRIKISVQSDKVTFGNQTNVPVYIDLNDLGTSFFDNVESDGSDIVVTSGDGVTKLYRELVNINTSSDTGELHFKSNLLSASVDTDFYIYYGSEINEQNSSQVWSDYRFVYHLEQDPSGAAPQIIDSSPNGLHATANGSMDSSDFVDTPMGKGLDFDGSNDYLSIIDTFDPTAYTDFAFLRPDVFTTSVIVRTSASGPTVDRSQQLQYSSGTFQGFTTAGSTYLINNSTTSPVDNYYGVHTGAQNGSYLYIAVEGSLYTTANIGTLSTIGDRYYIGSNSTGFNYFDGVMDEVRVASVRLDPGHANAINHNLKNPSTFYSVSSQEVSPFQNGITPFYDERWLFRKKISIQPSEVDDLVTNFPVYIDLSDLGSHFFSNVETDGSDVFITTSNGTKIPREIVSINTGTSTGELWFEAPYLSENFETEFYIYYGNPDATETNDDATWDNGYNMVLHMEEDPTPSGGDEMIDSSGTANHANSGSLMTIANSTTDAVMGRGLDFNANANQYIVIPNNATLYPNPISFSIWAKSDTTNWNEYGWVMSKNTATANGYIIHPEGGFPYVTAYMRNGAAWAQTTSLQPNASNWHHYLVTYNGSTNFYFYVDGVLIGSPALTSPNWSLNNLAIGRDFAVAGRNGNGKVDEARVMNRYLTAGWVTTEFNNQSDPEAFYFVSGEEIISNRIILENEATSTPTDITLIFNTNTDITANSLIRYSYDTAFTIGGSGLLTMSDMSIVCDDDGDVGGSSVSMNAVTVDSQGSGYFILDVNTDTCSYYTILTITGAGGQQFSTPSEQGNYEWSYNLDADANGVIEESYFILAYVIDGSEVNVTANVGSTLEFQLFEPNSDTQFDNTCNLGLLSINAIKTCVYDIATSVSSPTGVSVEIATDGDFRDGQGNIVSYCSGGTCDGDSVNGVTVGSEEYGYQVTDSGSGTYIIVNSFDIADQPLPLEPTLLAVTTESGSGTNVGSSAFRMEVTHKVAINEGSIRGLYGHVVRYTVYTN